MAPLLTAIPASATATGSPAATTEPKAEDRDRIRARSRLIHGTPELASAVNGQLTDFERLLARTLAEVHGRAPDDLEARVVAAVSVAAMRCAIEQWSPPTVRPTLAGCSTMPSASSSGG